MIDGVSFEDEPRVREIDRDSAELEFFAHHRLGSNKVTMLVPLKLARDRPTIEAARARAERYCAGAGGDRMSVCASLGW